MVGASGQCCRLVVATHPVGPTKKRIGVQRDGLIYELFLTKLPQEAFTAADVVALYLHRGAFETTLSDEDSEQEPDRWCSQTACGQEAWQIVSQWIWNLRLELGHQLEPEPMRTTEFAPALPPAKEHAAPASGYAAASVALPFKQAASLGVTLSFSLMAPCVVQLDRCCVRPKSATRLMAACGWSMRLASVSVEAVSYESSVSGMVATHRSHVGSVCCSIRSRSARLPCSGRIGVADSIVEPVCSSCVTNGLTYTWSKTLQPCSASSAPVLSRAQRAHYQLSWEERLACNASASMTGRSTITLFGVPEGFANRLGLLTA